MAINTNIDIDFINHKLIIKFISFTFSLLILVLFSTHLHAQTNNELNNQFRLAQNYELAGQLDKAESILRDLVKKQNNNYTYFESLNKIIVKQKKYTESIDLIENRIKQTPQDINLYGMLGTTYYMMDDLKDAYASWERGIDTNPTSAVVYRVMANYAIENRTFKEAIDFLERGQKHTDDPLIFSLDLANIYSANMRFGDAANEYCKLLEVRPNEVEIVKSRMNAFLTRPGFAEATIEAVKKFAEEKPLPQILNLLTFVYTAAGKYDDAFTTAVRYDEKTNSNGNFIFTFAQNAFRNKQYSIASKAYNYVVNNYSSSTLLPIAKVSYAISLKESIDEKYQNDNETWKPFSEPKVIHREEYISVIKAFEQLSNDYLNNAVYPQAIYNMAKIYEEKLYDYNIADSLFAIINNQHSQTDYSILSFIQRGKISIILNNLDDAKNFFMKLISVGNVRPDEKTEAKYFLARIDFWEGNFSNSLNMLSDISSDLSSDYANDALELSTLINAAKRDSLNLSKYAKGDLYSFQNKFKEAANEFKTLADNPNLFIINDFANFKFAEMLIAENEIPTAIKILEVLSDSSKSVIFGDKALFLLAEAYQYGIKDMQKAVQNYEKLLEKFPNSLYFDNARESLNLLETKNG